MFGYKPIESLCNYRVTSMHVNQSEWKCKKMDLKKLQQVTKYHIKGAWS